MYNPVKISDAFGNIADALLNNYGELFELEADDASQQRIMKLETTRFIRKLQYIAQPFAAALQSNDEFKDTMEGSLMYHAYNFGNSDIINAFYPRLSKGAAAAWFEVVVIAKWTPLQMLDGSIINLDLNRL
jgi:hypothetical protein